MRTWKILRDCCLKGDSVHHAMLGITRTRNLAFAGQIQLAIPQPTMPETARRSFAGQP